MSTCSPQPGPCPFSRETELLDSIPGVDKLAAEMLLAEDRPGHEPISDRRTPRVGGWDVSRPARIGRQEASAATRNGLQWLRGTLTECAKKLSCAPKVPTSVPATTASTAGADMPKQPSPPAHKILTAAYHVLGRDVPHHELGEGFFYRLDT
jgi:hypothetical protein